MQGFGKSCVLCMSDDKNETNKHLYIIMKKLKFIAFVIGCLFIGTALTSCLNNNDDNTGLTKEQQKSAYLQVKGDYAGKIVYSKLLSDSKYANDTLDISWSIDTDSTMLIKKFPSTLLAQNITNESIKTAMAACDPVDIKCYTGYYSLSPVAFVVNPTSVTYNLSYDGTSHKVQVVFYVNNTYSFGSYQPLTTTLQIQIVEAGVYVDGTYQSGLLKLSTPFKMYCKK